MILNIRGCSGSGKTYLVRQIMEELGPPEPLLHSDGRIEGYLLKDNIRVVGPYLEGCGGCDRLGITKAHVAALREICRGERESLEVSVWDSLVKHIGEKDARKLVEKIGKGKKPGGAWGSAARAEVLVRRYSELERVIFEGVLISDCFGRWAKVAEDCGGFIWTFLDTPLEVCHERVLIRNGGKPFNLERLEFKYHWHRCVAKKAAAAGQQVVWLDHRRAFEQVMEILEGGGPPAAPDPPREKFSLLSPF